MKTVNGVMCNFKNKLTHGQSNKCDITNKQVLSMFIYVVPLMCKYVYCFPLFRLSEANHDKEGESADKEEETAAENSREEQPMTSDTIDPDINIL